MESVIANFIAPSQSLFEASKKGAFIEGLGQEAYCS
jgi:hypothetical protein